MTDTNTFTFGYRPAAVGKLIDHIERATGPDPEPVEVVQLMLPALIEAMLVMQLGTINAEPKQFASVFRMAIYRDIGMFTYRDYDPDVAPSVGYVDFHITRRSENEEVKQPTRWTRQYITTETTVFETDAALEDLMAMKEFIPAGFNAIRDRIRGGRYQ